MLQISEPPTNGGFQHIFPLLPPSLKYFQNSDKFIRIAPSINRAVNGDVIPEVDMGQCTLRQLLPCSFSFVMLPPNPRHTPHNNHATRVFGRQPTLKLGLLQSNGDEIDNFHWYINMTCDIRTA